ncbi:hypothetical protein M3Y96_00369400 [Aphelenchoides besseyi]|nr:hypothetical protein M3Y96_00369400 [Aphelenchoides besseyi]
MQRGKVIAQMIETFHNQQPLTNVDTDKWYQLDHSSVSTDLNQLYYPSSIDEETYEFLNSSTAISQSACLQFFYTFSTVLLRVFATKTTINGILDRGKMFVFSTDQLGSFLSVDANWVPENKAVIDLGAGDGHVSLQFKPFFGKIYATEASSIMEWRLQQKGIHVLPKDDWKSRGPFNLISALNLLDRFYDPHKLLSDIREVALRDNALVLIAVVLPLRQYVEFHPDGKQKTAPNTNIHVIGRTYQSHLNSMARDVFRPAGFQVIRWTKLPYLCEGDLHQDKENTKKAIEEKKRELDEYDQLKTKVSDLTKRLEKSIFIPVGKMAFIPGTLDHTNEFYTMIGDNTFVKKSSHRTVELLNRRTDLVKKDLKEMQEQLKLVEQRIEFAENLVTSSNEIEIREPYDETKETPASKRRKHDEIMSRLDELEREENENGELAQPAELTATEVDGEEDKPFDEEIDIENMRTPKGVPRKDFERLLTYLNAQDVESSNSEEDATDSDDRSYSSASEEEQQDNLINVQKVELQKSELKITSKISSSDDPPVVSQSSVQQTTKQTPQRRKSVQFNDSPLGPATSSSTTTTEAPHSILRQTDHVPRVDWQAVEAMNRRDQKLILPESKDAVMGIIVERDPLAVLPERPTEEPNKKVSKFKKERTAN